MQGSFFKSVCGKHNSSEYIYEFNLGNRAGQVGSILVELDFIGSEHISIIFNRVLEKKDKIKVGV